MWVIKRDPLQEKKKKKKSGVQRDPLLRLGSVTHSKWINSYTFLKVVSEFSSFWLPCTGICTVSEWASSFFLLRSGLIALLMCVILTHVHLFTANKTHRSTHKVVYSGVLLHLWLFFFLSFMNQIVRKKYAWENLSTSQRCVKQEAFWSCIDVNKLNAENTRIGGNKQRSPCQDYILVIVRVRGERFFPSLYAVYKWTKTF